MKVHSWIDKYNYKVCFKINQRYYQGISNQNLKLYAFYPTFWLQYLFRLLLVSIAIITLKNGVLKRIYKKGKSSFLASDGNSDLYIFFREFIAALFGYRYFVEDETLPLLDKKAIYSTHISFTVTKSPVISIIILNISRLDYLYNCLWSIKSKVSNKYSFEIIICENSDPDIATFIHHNLSGVSIYGDSTLDGIIAQSNGRAIYLHSCNTQVAKYCLENLMFSLENEENGCIISKQLHVSGLLFRKHRDMFYFEDSNNPNFNHQLILEDCASSNIIFRKSDFDALSEKNPNNLTEETVGPEIRSIVASMNIRTIYQPLAKTIRYSDKLPLHVPSLTTNQDQISILFIDDFIPTPDQDSGSNRLFKIMQLVKSIGLHVIFLPANGIKTPRYFEKMTREGFEVLYRFPNRKGMIEILENKLNSIDAVWVCKPNNNMEFSFLFEKKKDLYWIYDTIDLHFIRLKREAELSLNTSLMEKANGIKKIELGIAKRADVTLAITNDEHDILQKEGIANIKVIPNIHERQEISGKIVPYNERVGLLFIGGYLHRPNVDAARWLVEDIMPLVWQDDPLITLTLLGSNPTDEILALRSDRVFVPGFIRDVSSYFFRSRVFVSPLRFGAGMKGKIGQSLEFGLPIVSTDIGVEGMGLRDQVDVMVANDSVEFAKKILTIYQSSELWHQIHQSTKEVLKPFSPEVVKQQLRELLKEFIPNDKYEQT